MTEAVGRAAKETPNVAGKSKIVPKSVVSFGRAFRVHLCVQMFVSASSVSSAIGG